MDFKSIVDNVTTKASEIAKTAVKKTGEAAESAKNAITLKSENNKLEGLFTTLGKLFYEQTKGTDMRAQIGAQIMQIDEQKLVIENLRAVMAESSGKMVCKFCGKDIDIDSTFCPVCGKKIEPKFVFDEAENTEPNSETEETV